MTVSPAVTGAVPLVQQPTPLVANPSPPSSAGPSFGDVLDAVNPLQHIPVVSSLYRAATGSQISMGSQIAGDTLYGTLFPGGALAGFASSVANAAVKEVSGKDIGQLVVSAFTPSSSASASSPSATATPLTATASAPATAAANVPAVPYAQFNHAADRSSSQYQRVQAMDALNRQLLKMTA